MGVIAMEATQVVYNFSSLGGFQGSPGQGGMFGLLQRALLNIVLLPEQK